MKKIDKNKININKLSYIFNNFELNSSLSKIISLIDKFFDKKIIVIGLQWDNLIYCKSNDFLFNDSYFQHQHLKNEELIILNEFEVELASNGTKDCISKAINITTGTSVGFITIAGEKGSLIDIDDRLVEICSLTATIIEKHLEAQKITDVFTDFVHKIIHDLKNPFTSISLTTELLQKKNNDHTAVKMLIKKLEITNKKVFEKLAYLLKIFPTRNESFKLNITKFNSTDVIENVVDQLNPLIGKEITASFEIQSDKNVLTEAITLMVTHLILLNIPIEKIGIKSLIDKQNSAYNERILIYGYTHLVNENGKTEHLETNAFVIADKLVAMLDGTTETTYSNSEQKISYIISLK